MTKSTQHNNEIVSLTLMLLLVAALAAGQADATAQNEVRVDVEPKSVMSAAKMSTAMTECLRGAPYQVARLLERKSALK